MIEMTASEHREAAKKCHKSAFDSFERCDTDGFLSQWASGLTAREHELQADILDAGGVWKFWGLYEGDRRVKAKRVSVYNKFKFQSESKWVVEDDDPIASRRKWIPCGDRSRVQKGLGLSEREEFAPAMAAMRGDGIAAVRTGCKLGSDSVLVEDKPEA